MITYPPLDYDYDDYGEVYLRVFVKKNDLFLELHQDGQLGPPVSDEKLSLSQEGQSWPRFSES